VFFPVRSSVSCSKSDLFVSWVPYLLFFFFYSDSDLVPLWCDFSSNVRTVPNLTKYCRLPALSMISIQMLCLDCCLSAHGPCHCKLLLQLLCQNFMVWLCNVFFLVLLVLFWFVARLVYKLSPLHL
jgi:hypothetical protein